MTAEVAILNTAAACLAADSAVTIGTPPNHKIYNTVNKIFELSDKFPVGIMIYNRLDFMGLPLETIIKEYRKFIPDAGFDTIEEYCNNFKNYLSDEVPYKDQDIKNNTFLILIDIVNGILASTNSHVLEYFRQNKSFQTSKVNKIAQSHFLTIENRVEKFPDSQGFSKFRLDKNIYYKDFCDLVEQKLDFARATIETKNRLWKLANIIVRKNELSRFKTGVVVCGFGQTEYCPTLVNFEIDGIIGNKLKSKDVYNVDVGRNGNRSFISGFAQTDIVEGFIDGLSSDMRSYVETLIRDGIMNTSQSLIKNIYTNSTDRRNVASILQPVIGQIINKFTDKLKEEIDRNSNPIYEMVQTMPKSELPGVAASLIELTSVKKKVTREAETVGGDVDVAVISKSEGFVWIRRKHYFPSELNARFMARHYDGGKP